MTFDTQQQHNIFAGIPISIGGACIRCVDKIRMRYCTMMRHGYRVNDLAVQFFPIMHGSGCNVIDINSRTLLVAKK